MAQEHNLAIFRGRRLRFKSNESKIWGVFTSAYPS